MINLLHTTRQWTSVHHNFISSVRKLQQAGVEISWPSKGFVYSCGIMGSYPTEPTLNKWERAAIMKVGITRRRQTSELNRS